MAKYIIEIEADDHDDAAQHAMAAATLLKMGMTIANGYNPNGGVLWDLKVENDEYEHGDYRDEDGNLLHVARDSVVHVTWANAEAKTEDTDVPVREWVKEHGVISKAE